MVWVRARLHKNTGLVWFIPMHVSIYFDKGASKSILAFFDDVVWLYKNTGLVWFIAMHVLSINCDTSVRTNELNYFRIRMMSTIAFY